MSIYTYLQLQPVEPDQDDDEKTSDLDTFEKDETIDLKEDVSGEELEKDWAEITKDLEKDPSWFNFDDEE